MQRCQFVVVEVVAVALRNGKSAADDLMEWHFNPTLICRSAEVCGVRHMCVCWNSDKCALECVFVNSKKIQKTTFLRYLICVAATSRPELVFFRVVQDECWDIRCDRWLWVSPCLWRRRIPPWKPRIEDHDDHCSASGSEDCLGSVFSLFHCPICVYSLCSAGFMVSLPPPW